MSTIFCCKIKDDSESPVVTGEFLSALELSFSSWFDLELNYSIHTIYAEDEEAAQSVAELLSTLSAEWKACGVKLASVDVVALKDEDWTEVWKKYFKIQHVSPRLVVKPCWLEYQAREFEEIIEIDPGMSFGTGRHPTTRYCLRMLDKLNPNSEKKSFLDVGCGSSILTIAAVKLGYSPVAAMDNDAVAIESAISNLAANGVGKKTVNPELANFSDYAAQNNCEYDVVGANLLTPLLLKQSHMLLSMLKYGGYLILSGIQVEEYRSISEQYSRLGCVEEDSFTEAEWRSGLWRKK